jgi:hypothetical protein
VAGKKNYAISDVWLSTQQKATGRAHPWPHGFTGKVELRRQAAQQARSESEYTLFTTIFI